MRNRYAGGVTASRSSPTAPELGPANIVRQTSFVDPLIRRTDDFEGDEVIHLGERREEEMKSLNRAKPPDGEDVILRVSAPISRTEGKRRVEGFSFDAVIRAESIDHVL